MLEHDDFVHNSWAIVYSNIIKLQWCCVIMKNSPSSSNYSQHTSKCLETIKAESGVKRQFVHADTKSHSYAQQTCNASSAWLYKMRGTMCLWRARGESSTSFARQTSNWSTKHSGPSLPMIKLRRSLSGIFCIDRSSTCFVMKLYFMLNSIPFYETTPRVQREMTGCENSWKWTNMIEEYSSAFFLCECSGLP